jgi:serine/threonine-protein kinase
MIRLSDRTTPLPLSAVNAAGHIVAGRYRLRSLIAQGGTGAVYEAEHVETGQPLALKTLLPDVPAAARVAERFRREAHAAPLLDHPNIVRVFDLVVDGNTLCLVMELLHGRPLGELMEAGPIAPRRALVIVRQVLEALAHAHARGVIHRDLKPDNIMIVNAGEPGREHEMVKLLDFGFLKLVGDAAAGSDKLTKTGVVAGTPTYMAPEQVLGRLVDARIDLYSLGVVGFEMLTGRAPFRSPDPQMLMRMHVSAPVPSLAGVAPGQRWCTPALEHLVARALAKDPELRFRDATEMITALDAAFLSLDHLPPERS